MLGHPAQSDGGAGREPKVRKEERGGREGEGHGGGGRSRGGRSRGGEEEKGEGLSHTSGKPRVKKTIRKATTNQM